MSIANQTTPVPISQGVQGSSSLLVVSAHQPSNHNTYGSDHPNTTTRNDSIISPVEMSPNIIHKLLIEMDERIDKLFQQLDGIDNLNVDLEEEHSEMTKLMGYIKNEVNYLTKTTSSSTTKQIPLGKELENLKRSDSFSTDKDSKNLYVKSPVKTPNPEQKSGTKTTIQRMKDLKDQFNAQFKKTIQPKQPEYKKIVRRYLFHRDAVFDIKMSPVCSIDTSTPLFASASADSTCCLWGSNFSHLNPLLVYKGHSGAVNRIKFHPTAQMVCSVSGDQSVHLWKFADTLKQNNALTLNQSNSGHYVGENDDDDDSSNRFKSYFRHSKLPSIDNIHKASTEFDEYNETQHDLFTQDLLDSHIDFKAYQNEGVNTDSENDDSLNELQKYYITEDGVQGMIRNRPTYLRNPHVKNTESHKGIISSCDFTHHNRGDNIITSCWDGCVRILDLELREVQKISSPAETAYLNDVTCAYQSSLIACASSDGNVFLWDSHSDSKSPISSLKSHSDPVNCVAFTPSDRFIITGTDSGELRIFDYRNMTKPVKTVPIKSGGVNNISISEYHQRMLVSLDKRVAKIYDLSGHCHTTLRGHELMVTSACWSYDGSTAFTASIDRQIIQHDVTDGQSQSNVNNED